PGGLPSRPRSRRPGPGPRRWRPARRRDYPPGPCGRAHRRAGAAYEPPAGAPSPRRQVRSARVPGVGPGGRAALLGADFLPAAVLRAAGFFAVAVFVVLFAADVFFLADDERPELPEVIIRSSRVTSFFVATPSVDNWVAISVLMVSTTASVRLRLRLTRASVFFRLRSMRSSTRCWNSLLLTSPAF